MQGSDLLGVVNDKLPAVFYDNKGFKVFNFGV